MAGPTAEEASDIGGRPAAWSRIGAASNGPVAKPRLATFDSCKIDDTDNRLFGITAQVSRAATQADQPFVRM
ncbi:hypothetical protein [Rhodopseudomonas palustris]|uniref:hypothetical protein n=1 Tax=Rhodopseudomonas palustris TaxID=1076 RepID=UPI000D1A1A16|nr:hypothetical protein [Rhodopseudomonas palustris]